MSEQKFGSKILTEVQTLYTVMKGHKTTYGSGELPSFISLHVPSLVRTPCFRSNLWALVEENTSWGRRIFILRVFELIRREFGIEVPSDPDYVPKAAKADAMAEAVEAQIALVEMYEDDLRLERARMEAEHRPWDDD